jgi:hypothetical protein
MRAAFRRYGCVVIACKSWSNLFSLLFFVTSVASSITQNMITNPLWGLVRRHLEALKTLQDS